MGREEKMMQIIKEKYEKVKEKATKQKQKWQFIIDSKDKSLLLNKSLDVMCYGHKIVNQFVIGVDNKNKNFYIFSEKNFDIVGYAIYKLPFSYINGMGFTDGSEYWIKITEHRPEIVEKKNRKVKHYIELNKDQKIAEDIRMYQKWQSKNK